MNCTLNKFWSEYFLIENTIFSWVKSVKVLNVFIYEHWCIVVNRQYVYFHLYSGKSSVAAYWLTAIVNYDQFEMVISLFGDIVVYVAVVLHLKDTPGFERIREVFVGFELEVLAKVKCKS